MPATPYTHYLLSLATEQQAQPDATKRPDTIADPTVFLNGMLRFFDYSMTTKAPITRLGMERALDALFSLPALTPILDAPENSQNGFATAWLPQTCPLFQSYWTHIIVPAWNQHADIRRTCLATSDGTTIGAAAAPALALA